jgi:hypothetical protein
MEKGGKERKKEKKNKTKGNMWQIRDWERCSKQNQIKKTGGWEGG